MWCDMFMNFETSVYSKECTFPSLLTIIDADVDVCAKVGSDADNVNESEIPRYLWYGN